MRSLRSGARPRTWRAAVAAIAMTAALGAACSRAPSGAPAAQAPVVVVTTSLLECAVRDVGGEDFVVVRLAPPGACPGHFDVTPGQMERIAGAALFIRHDYQAHLDRRLTDAGRSAKRCVAVESRGAQTIPENYVAVCRRVAEALSELAPHRAEAIRARLAAGIARIEPQADALRTEAARSLDGVRVVATRLQEEFCRWAGAEVVAVFDPGDQASLRGFEETVRAAEAGRPLLVVGNLQRGEREARSLAERLGVPAAILSNFPDFDRGQDLVGLIGENLEALRTAAGR